MNPDLRPLSTTRTFIAVAASNAVRKRTISLSTKLGRGIDSVKWVAQENLHFTLQFLGDVDDATVAGICRNIATAAAGVRAFNVHVIGAGAFPKIDRPRTIWLDVDDGADAMIALQNKVTDALRPLDVHLDLRPFSPHLTIGRVRGRRGAGETTSTLAGRIGDHAEFDAGTMTVDRVTVYASELLRHGPVYQVLSKARLSG